MVTFLFAAGASIPFFKTRLTTDYLTKQLKDYNAWQDVIAHVGSEQNEVGNVDISIVIRIIDFIVKVKSDANFEEIIEVLDKISSYQYDKSPNANLFNLTIFAMNNQSYDCDLQNETKQSWWLLVPFLAREIIVSSILDLEKSERVDNYDELQQKQEHFLTSAASKDSSSSIVSLNYDNVIVQSAFNCDYRACYKQKSANGGLSIDAKEILESERVIYFPHGHTRFVFNKSDDVEYHSCPEYADEERCKSIGEGYSDSAVAATNEKVCLNFNTFIVTGQTKDVVLNHAPYSYYYQRFAIDCKESDIIFTIGYSFGDDHINRFLMSFLQLSEKNKLVVIDYYNGVEGEGINILKERGTGSIIDRLQTVTKRFIDIYADNETNSKWTRHQQGEIDLNNKGFGEIYDNLYFYKKGYQEFLDEHEEIIKFLEFN